MRQAAIEAMLPFLADGFANPSGAHRFARQARPGRRRRPRPRSPPSSAACPVRSCSRAAARRATTRRSPARYGATVVSRCARRPNTTACSTSSSGTTAGSSASTSYGRADLDQLAAALDGDVSIVSVMAVNNEVGSINDIAAVAERRPRRCAGGAGPHRRRAGGVLARPAPALAARRPVVAERPQVRRAQGRRSPRRPQGRHHRPAARRGGQERDRRSGTHNVPGIVAMAAALAATDAERDAECERIAAAPRSARRRRSSQPSTVSARPSRPSVKVAGGAHVCVDGVESESLLFLLDEAGLCASAASACASGAMEPSHVLAAMGVEPNWSAGALRMTLGRTTTDADVDRAIDILVDGDLDAARAGARRSARERAERCMKVMVAMSGGVDSSVAAALLAAEGHDVVGVTMRLWGGESDTGCCSVSDVDDARRAADALGVEHLVFNFSDDFDAHVVSPYVSRTARASTPNPCIECNRKVKFARLSERAAQLGFDAVATGHHARIGRRGGRFTLERGADRAKDQSYVVHMLDQARSRPHAVPDRHADQGEVRAPGRRSSGCARRRSRTARTSASSPPPAGASSSSAGASRSRRLASSTPADRASARSRRSSSSPSANARASASPVAARSATSSPSTDRRRPSSSATRANCSTTRSTSSRRPGSTGPVEGDVLVQTSAHGTPHRATAQLTDDGRARATGTSRNAASHPARASCSTTSTTAAFTAAASPRDVDPRSPFWRHPPRIGRDAGYRPESYGDRIADVYDELVRRRQRRRRHRRVPRRPRRRTARRASSSSPSEPAGWRSRSPPRPRRHRRRRQRGDARPAARRRRRPGGSRTCSATWSTISPRGRSTSCSSPSTRCSCSPTRTARRRASRAVAARLAPAGAFVVEAFVPWDPPRGGPTSRCAR